MQRAQRIERRQEIRSQRQQAVQPQPSARSKAAAPAIQAAPSQSAQGSRIRELQSQRRLSGSERRELRTLQRTERQNAKQNTPAAAPSAARTTQSAAQSTQQKRIEQLQSQRRLSRSERRELRGLQRTERQNVQQNATGSTQAAGNTAQQQRIQALESKSRLSRSERRELRGLQRAERQNVQQNATGNTQAAGNTAQQQRIQALESKSRLSRSERRELRQLRRDERETVRQQQPNQPAAAAAARSGTPRAMRTRAISAQQVQAGRFASAQSINANNFGGRRAARRAALLAARTAWGLGLLAPYVPWRGPVYYPYAYNDVFYYTFWPDAYDPAYWAYAYDDFFDGVFFPDGAPYVEYYAEGPYTVPSTTGSAPARATTAAPGRVLQATRDFCADQAKGVTAWPLEKVADAVRPTAEQKELLDNLRKASEDAASQFKAACPDSVPLTPPGRLAAMVQRLQATDQAIQTVKPAMEAFYSSLNDEQKARFNEIGPQLKQDSQRNAKADTAQADCSGEKAGISNLAINRMEQAVQPTDTQGELLDKLDEALEKAVNTLRDACPNTTPMTPVGRLDVMQKRLEAMVAAGNDVQPALDAFYNALSDEQKAKLNRLGRQTAQSE